MITTDFGHTGLGQEIQYIPLLLTQSDHGSQNAFYEDATGFALGAEATSAPDDTPAQGVLGGIVGGFNALVSDESPQSGFQVEDILASLARAGMAQQGANLQQTLDLGLNRLHRYLEIGPAQGSVSHPMPKFKHLPDLFKEQSADDARLAPRSTKA
jgi:hypothetical protein